LASTLPCPVGFKNPLSGESLPAVQGAMVAKKSQTLIEHDDEGRLILRETPGNSAPHIVLRGGTCGPNYDESAVQRAKEELIAAHLPPAILIDCSHHNSSYNHLEQVRVAKEVVQQKQKEPAIRGIMLESFLLSGTQEHYKTSSLYELAKRNASILDPCLGWDETEALLQELSRLI
jgi:3-deoxy-7-phosphoheptulonate synthase